LAIGSVDLLAATHFRDWVIAYVGVTGTVATPVIQASEPLKGVQEEEYDPAFVAEILAADAAPNEATFDNVVDMLEWLERD